jgi:3-hydroxy-9,10-secoandrosta-1,3,5(10)-triene-9,17-dione monooxygenase reductase component
MVATPNLEIESSHEEFRSVMSHFTTGVTIVSALDEDRPVGFTCQSFVSLSIDPPLVSLAASKRSTSWPRIARAGIFCVNILADQQRDLCAAFAKSGGDKFAGIEWHASPNGAPIIQGSLAWVECELVDAREAGDHEYVIARVLELGRNGGKPLLYFRSQLLAMDAASLL